MITWEKDKWKHVAVAIPLGFILEWVFLSSFNDRFWSATFLAFSLLIFLCYLFEMFSLITDLGFSEFDDIVAGITGGVVGMIIYLVFEVLI